MVINFKKLCPEAVVPTKAHPTDAGFDMVATSITETDDYIEYGTGISIKLPEGHCALLFPRSSNSKKDLILSNSIGLIDENYTGEIKWRFKRVKKGLKLCLKKWSLFSIVSDVNVKFNELNIYNIGDRIGQMVIMPVPQIQFNEVDQLPETDRGEGGFGSTDTPTKLSKSRKRKTA